LSQGYTPDRIFIHGESLGAAVATYLASENPSRGLILEAPFTSAKAVAGGVLPLLGPLLVWGYDSLSQIDRVRVPVLIIHGDRDEIIPYKLGERLFNAANPPKYFWTVAGAGHNDLHVVGRTEFARRLAEFYVR
jgi:fermentation-respiration switch protein FrsA (DUF1100 family)